MDLAVGLVQAARSGGISDNISRVVRLVREELRGEEPDIIVLPENWLSPRPVPFEDYAHAVEIIYDSTGYNVIGGAQYVEVGDEIRSLGVAIVDGKSSVACEKIYPSKAVGERGVIRRGRLAGPLSIKGWRVGCIVCVDIFYPELARSLLYAGAEVIVNPASIPANRVGLWRAILHARAAENTVYTVGVNLYGSRYPDGRRTGGGSSVYTPDGWLEAEAGEGVKTLVVTLVKEVIRDARSRWAFYEDFKSYYKGLYGDLYRALRI